MNRMIVMVTLLAAALLPSMSAHAQSRVEGSRPGETYRVGERSGSNTQSDNQQAQQTREERPAAPNAARAVNGKPAGTPVIMEFSDLQCPDSARYNSGLKNQIMQRYVSSGRAAYEWHDFPLPSHPQAQEAAAAARCAGQNADMVRQRIMGNQAQLSENVYTGYAREAGVDSARFAECMRSGNTIREVMNDKALGQSLGVRGTPTLVLGMADANGRVQPVKVVKAYDPPQQVLAEIDSFLASAPQQGQSGQQPAYQGQAPANQGQAPAQYPPYAGQQAVPPAY